MILNIQSMMAMIERGEFSNSIQSMLFPLSISVGNALFKSSNRIDYVIKSHLRG